MSKLVQFVFLCFISFSSVFAQNRNFSFQHYGPEDGLSNANVFAIKQNSHNVLFLATENGVYQYDGYNFDKIKPKSNLKTSYTRNINFDASDNLLIINRREGIYEYNSFKNEVNLLQQLAFGNAVDELVYDDQFYYALNEQISVEAFSMQDKVIIEDGIKLKDKYNQAFAIYKSNALTVYVGRTDGLYRFENGKQLKVSFKKSFPVYSITEDNDGLLYLGTDNAIVCIKENQIIKIIPIKTQKTNSFFGALNVTHVSKIVVDKYKRIWFTNTPDDNLYLIENNITFDAFELLGIDKVLINCLYKDKDDHIWIGTFNDGVYFIQNPGLQNVSFTSGRKILPVTCAAYISSNIAVGTNNGLFIYDDKQHNAQQVIPPDDFFSENIYGLYPYKKQVLYSKLNSMTGGKRTFLVNGNAYQFYSVASRLFNYAENPNEAYLADGTASLFRIKNYTNENYTIIDTIVSYPDYRTKINTLCNKQQKLLIGTSDGLTSYQFKTKVITNFSNPIFKYSINDINEYANKTYIAHDNGITVFEDSTLIQQLGSIQLSTVKKIKFKYNKIWVATLDGLIICDTQFKPMAIINKSSGLLSNTINDIIFNDTTCCICTDKGITICNAKTLISQQIVSNKLFISFVDIDDVATILVNYKLQLQSNQSDVNIHFSSPLFVKPNKQYYKYQYDNTKWTSLDNTQVHLTSIEGGSHTLQIIYSYDNINWSQPLVITIKKDIPFKDTIWFVLSIVAIILIISITVAYFWLRRVRIKTTKKVQEERQVNLLKHQAMNSLMSPHFIFNSLTSIQNYINLNDSLRASEYLAKFSRLIRMIIEKASQSDIVLHEELTRLNYYLDLEKERFKGKFDYIVLVDENINTLETKIPNMIIQPYAENSIIHGILPKHEHGILTIHFKKMEAHTLLIIIDDDGIGFNKAKENTKAGHKSLGTRTIENILELNTKLTGKKQTVEIIDKQDLAIPEKGTRITITLQID